MAIRGMVFDCPREVIVRTCGPGRLALIVLFALGCSNSDSSGGCGGSGSARCEINATATVCGDRITLECFDGAVPEAASQCEIALQQEDEAIYCCTSAAEAADAETDGEGGIGGASGAGGAVAVGGGVAT